MCFHQTSERVHWGLWENVAGILAWHQAEPEADHRWTAISQRHSEYAEKETSASCGGDHRWVFSCALKFHTQRLMFINRVAVPKLSCSHSHPHGIPTQGSPLLVLTCLSFFFSHSNSSPENKINKRSSLYVFTQFISLILEPQTSHVCSYIRVLF